MLSTLVKTTKAIATAINEETVKPTEKDLGKGQREQSLVGKSGDTEIRYERNVLTAAPRDTIGEAVIYKDGVQVTDLSDDEAKEIKTALGVLSTKTDPGADEIEALAKKSGLTALCEKHGRGLRVTINDDGKAVPKATPPKAKKVKAGQEAA